MQLVPWSWHLLSDFCSGEGTVCVSHTCPACHQCISQSWVCLAHPPKKRKARSMSSGVIARSAIPSPSKPRNANLQQTQPAHLGGPHINGALLHSLILYSSELCMSFMCSKPNLMQGALVNCGPSVGTHHKGAMQQLSRPYC